MKSSVYTIRKSFAMYCVFWIVLSIQPMWSQLCNPNTIAGSIMATHTNLCINGSLSAAFVPNFQIQNNQVTWSFTGTSVGSGQIGPYTFLQNGVTGSGVLSTAGFYWNGGRWCSFNYNVNVNVFNPTVTAPTPLLFAPGSNLVLNSTPTGVGNPPNITWTPNSFFVTPSVNTDEDPTVSPRTSLFYTATVVDANGCTASTMVEVIAQPFAVLSKTTDGAYYELFDNKILFKYNGQYAASSLMYNVYNKAHTIVVSHNTTNIANTLVVNSGDNRYFLNASSLSSGYYTLEVINEKNEKQYLRFRK
jgi:hypothetical protein